ncbi:hypothetical protein [Staphylococcus ureilyticus]|uniref:hypothetical protein n=1 Tax=Staphylococcus ureilyticus TaxID=94138 RepID=UPI0021D36444|nr:hypothetical protein [Staphylococcus ureilyticus]UXS61045.1 hypothetical protein MUA21_05460 [Staphylococcus ureilyticus]
MYELNKQSTYSPPAYMQDMIFEKEVEVKLNDVGYKIENVEKSKKIRADNHTYTAQKKYLIMTLRVANYRNTDVTLKYNTFALTNNINTLYPDTKISEELNKAVSNNINEKIFTNIKANNVKKIHLVFNLNKNFMQAKDILLNVYSETNVQNRISIAL